MFKKFKDKLAEEVKSSPQRIQQFAQAAQAAVTSASSSISDITNNDLFSIGDNDVPTKSQPFQNNQNNMMLNSAQAVPTTSDFADFSMNFEDKQRQRRLSNSSFASDISFRLPNYESPSMYHLQSDMEVSASEAEEKGFGTANLDRVTKKQLYEAYRRTQDRCKKYKTQYSDLARHYKLLERENAKARNVLVETQDKALRRISELKEQCTLEQSAKAHLEKALRVDLEEKQMKIEALSTQLNLLQSDNFPEREGTSTENVQMPLINLNDDNESNDKEKEGSQSSEVTIISNKIEKLEQLLAKYKESLKAVKEKNANMTVEIQKLTLDLEGKSKENNKLQQDIEKMSESKRQVQELLQKIENLENMNNSIEFSKSKDISILEGNLQDSKEEVSQLQKKVQILSKREEEYAISLAENKLSIHKELESKEAEIKSLKDSLTISQCEIESLNKAVKDHKNEIDKLEGEQLKLSNDLRNLNVAETKIEELNKDLEKLNDKVKSLEILKTKSEENINCINLQLKQETAEKLSVIDRNVYLESRNSQLTEENEKKIKQINKLENEMLSLKGNLEDLRTSLEQYENNDVESNQTRLFEEATAWKLKCSSLESEIQEERVELVKLQTEIEKLLSHHESLQKQNLELNATYDEVKLENVRLHQKIDKYQKILYRLKDIKTGLSDIHNIIALTTSESRSLKEKVLREWLPQIEEKIISNSSEFQKDLNNIQQKNIYLKEEIAKITDEQTLFRNNANLLQNENRSLRETLEQRVSECADLSEKLRVTHSEYENIVLKLKNQFIGLEEEKRDFVNKVEVLESTITSLREELNEVRHENKNNILRLDTLLKENNEARQIKTEHADKCNYIEELETKLQSLKQENSDIKILQAELDKKNTTMESQMCELLSSSHEIENNLQTYEQQNQELKLLHVKIENNSKKIESELHELRTTHSKMEDNVKVLSQENRDLIFSKANVEEKCNNIESELCEVRNANLELDRNLQAMNQNYQDLKSLHAEIENNFKITDTKLHEMQNMYSEMEKGKVNLEHDIVQLKNNEATHLKRIEELQESVNSQNSKTCECDILKDENKRLHSDIEGLQTYLSKISKENSDLNDKMRELIASSDNTLEGDEHLKNKIQIGKEKIDELLRENSLLIEENLELKDQIQSHNSTNVIKADQKSASDNHTEVKDVHEKYYSLLENKNNLELKVNELEQMNNSLNKNVDQTQVNYDRLKLSNEKLQRKLDEALVSLRHLHALEENTELEYLRNILYEYLTGSGSHSMTLAKVLAAVVKFDNRQTEQILQKEKERQGFLRQLGII